MFRHSFSTTNKTRVFTAHNAVDFTADGVFSEYMLEKFIATKRAECRELSANPHPAELDKYYNL